MPSKRQKQELLRETAAQFRKAVEKRDEKFGDTALLTVEELQREGELLRQEAGILDHEIDENGEIRYLGLTEVRLSVFLHTLAETGSMAAAARRATPWSLSKGGGVETFTEYAERNEMFADALKVAQEFALGKLEHEAVRRAMTPTLRPIVSNGILLGEEEKYDNHLLLEVLRVLDPEKWNEKKEVRHTGEITHGVLAIPSTTSVDDWEHKFKHAEQPKLDVVEAEILEARNK